MDNDDSTLDLRGNELLAVGLKRLVVGQSDVVFASGLALWVVDSEVGQFGARDFRKTVGDDISSILLGGSQLEQ